jgi:hypothetical protein
MLDGARRLEPPVVEEEDAAAARRRSIMRKPSFLDIEADPVEDSFLDLDRSSFDTEEELGIAC